MTTAENDLQQFNQFVRHRLETVDPANVNLCELMDEWQLQHPSDAQYAENVEAVNAAIADFKQGDRGKRAGEFTRELRKSME